MPHSRLVINRRWLGSFAPLTPPTGSPPPVRSTPYGLQIAMRYAHNWRSPASILVSTTNSHSTAILLLQAGSPARRSWRLPSSLDEVLSLPLHPGLTEADVDHVIGAMLGVVR